MVDAAEGNYETRVPLSDVEDEMLEIEVGINFLLDELTHQRARNESHQRALVAALSTPIIVLWPGVLALPLIGHFDRGRAMEVTATLLARVRAERASHVILDLTGLAELAGDTMPALLRMVQAMRLLGARCLLTGMHPRSAQQVVELGIELRGVPTLAQVSDALAQVMSEKGVFKTGT